MSIQYSVPAVDQHPWVPLKTITTVQALLTTAKDETTVDALTATGIAKYIVGESDSAISLRFVGAADASANVVQVYALRKTLDGIVGDYEPVVGITLTGGSQVQSGVGTYADTAVVVANSEVWPTAIAFSSQADNGVAKVTLNTHGYEKFLFIAPTLATKLIVEVAVV
jgi:hypothetical protein